MRWKQAVLKALAGLTVNLSSGWFGAIVIVPNFAPLNNRADVIILIYDVFFDAIFLALAVLLEKTIKP